MIGKQQSQKERVIIFLDGSNFYHRLRDPELDFKRLLAFDYQFYPKHSFKKF